jgi:hypothetical protein
MKPGNFHFFFSMEPTHFLPKSKEKFKTNLFSMTFSLIILTFLTFSPLLLLSLILQPVPGSLWLDMKELFPNLRKFIKKKKKC